MMTVVIPPHAPTITTDALTYLPGQTVNVSGQYFAPGEKISLAVAELSADGAATYGEPTTLRAGGNGRFQTSFAASSVSLNSTWDIIATEVAGHHRSAAAVYFDGSRSTGNGLAATYYDGAGLTNRVSSRVDAQIALGNKRELPTGVNPRSFSAEWLGQMIAPSSQTFVFALATTGEARLWINGQEIINAWSLHKSKIVSGSVALTQGQTYDIRLDYAYTKGAINSALYWGTSTIPVQLVPAWALTQPPVVSGLQVASTTSTSATITWTPVSTDVQLFRNGHSVTILAAGAETYTDSGLSPQSQYNYTLAATDNIGLISATTGSVAAMTAAPTATQPPSAPGSPTLVTATASSISFDWSPSSAGAGISFYTIYRDGIAMGTVGATVTQYTDATVSAGSSYMYTVTATDLIGNISPVSSTLTATTLQAPPPTPALAGQWNLTFNDNFNSIDPNTWTNGEYYWDGNAGTQATFVPSAATTSNGILSLTATRQATTANNGTTMPYSSGLLTTDGIQGETPVGFDFTYGYVETRAEMAPGYGTWSAFWMLPVSHQDDYEIDLFENLGKNPTTFQGFDHDWPNFGTSAIKQMPFDLTSGYHTYGLDWEPNSVTWYVDGQVVKTYTNKYIVPSQAMYFIMNLDMGGWAGDVNSSSPQTTSWNTDYIRVWQHPGDQSQSASTTAVAASQNPAAVGQPITLTATVAPSGPNVGLPTGTVTFMDGSTALGSGTLNSSGLATLVISSLAAGPHAITAVYSGDDKFFTSTSPAMNVLIQSVGSALPTQLAEQPAGPTFSNVQVQSVEDALTANSTNSSNSAAELAESTPIVLSLGITSPALD